MCNLDIKYYNFTAWSFLLSHQHNCLSADELATAKQFKCNALSQRFVISRILLRLFLSQKLNLEPASIKFAYNAFSKPYLAGHPLHFNISHTDHLLCIASANTEIGIDIESTQNALHTSTGITSYLNTFQRAYADTLNVEAQHRYLQQKWTQLESIAKCIGQGLLLDFSNLTWRKDTPYASLIEYKKQQYLSYHIGHVHQHYAAVCMKAS